MCSKILDTLRTGCHIFRQPLGRTLHANVRAPLSVGALSLASDANHNTRRIRLLLASSGPSAEIYARAMSAVRSP